mmetsp:Transcript_35766/g.47200  ORF Transcript_35766/g.47200 Transcript_35766/m.47200 type:complete len:526 (+) Transcript_35766:75-1652(+)
MATKAGRKWEMWKTNKVAKDTEQYLKEKEARRQNFVEAEGRQSVSSLKSKFEVEDAKEEPNPHKKGGRRKPRMPDTPEVYYQRKIQESTDVLKSLRFQGIGLQSYVQNLDLSTRFGKEKLMKAFVKSQEENTQQAVTVEQAINFLDQVKIRPMSPSRFSPELKYSFDYSAAEERAPANSEPGRRRSGSSSPRTRSSSPRKARSGSPKPALAQPSIAETEELTVEVGHEEQRNQENRGMSGENSVTSIGTDVGIGEDEWNEWAKAAQEAVWTANAEKQNISSHETSLASTTREESLLEEAVIAGISKANEAQPDPPLETDAAYETLNVYSKQNGTNKHREYRKKEPRRRAPDGRSSKDPNYNGGVKTSWKIVDEPVPEPEPNARQPQYTKEPTKGAFGQGNLKPTPEQDKKASNKKWSKPVSNGRSPNSDVASVGSYSTFTPVKAPERRSSSPIKKKNSPVSPPRAMMFQDVLGPTQMEAEEEEEAFEIVDEKHAVGDMIKKFDKPKDSECFTKNPSSECQACAVM